MFNRMISISYGITVNDEFEEIDHLLDFLIPRIDVNDEIIVLQDVTHENKEVSDKLHKYKNNILILHGELNKNFANFKNLLIKNASKKYLFQIDADELPSKDLIKDIKKIIMFRFFVDCFSVPRVNIVRNIEKNDIEKWGWIINEKGYINYPDYQMRIIKLGQGVIWINPVHEVLINFNRCKKISIKNEKYYLYHDKTIQKQRIQNEFYEQNYG